jgi:predicted MFS family arabinose efflux permease
VTLHSLTPNFSLLTVGRIASGLGAGVLAASTVVLALRAGHLRGRRIAVAAGAGALAAVLGHVVGLALARSFGWRLAFVISVPPTIIALLASVIGGLIMVTNNRPAPR